MSKEILDEINFLIKRYFDEQKEEEFIPGKTKIPLAVPQFGSDEVIESMESLISTWVTMGKKVKRFEKEFNEFVGQKKALMVNSGSSANLLALSALSSQNFKNRIKPGDEIICPAVTWSTSLYPILNVGAKPVLVDVDINTLNVTPEIIDNAITPKTKAIMAVHLMGNPCQTDKIKQIADARGINLIEDCCEAHGAKIGKKSVGSFGICSTFSFFLSHHITTVEGGMVLTNDDTIVDIATAQRAHGWIREIENSEKIANQYPDIDKRFLFYETGFNLRPTEIQGAFGIHQMKKLNIFVDIRRKIAKEWNKALNEFKEYFILPEERENTIHSYFAYPITIKEDSPFTKKEITEFLESKLIETRPIAGGNLTEQPSAELYDYKIGGELESAKLIMKNSFFIGIHTGIKKQQQKYVIDTFNEFLTNKVKR
jgi:CDP-4-dehydro-6-deoxyglucose reductase, E1